MVGAMTPAVARTADPAAAPYTLAPAVPTLADPLVPVLAGSSATPELLP
jgi:hypothetical protein